MRILIINYYYAPTIDAHAYRWQQLAPLLAARGHSVEVLTAAVRGLPKVAREHGVEVHRVGVLKKPMPRPLLSMAPAAPSVPARPRGPTWRGRLAQILRPIYRKFYWPDAMWHWIPTALFAMLERRSVPYDLVISYYPCFGAHFAAAFLRRISSAPRATWIADYGDPFSTSENMQPNNFALFGALNRRVERRVLRSADAVAFTNEATAEAYDATLGTLGHSIVIPHLADIAKNHAGPSSPRTRSGDAYLLTYVGGFHRSIREPGRLFDIMRGLNRRSPGRYVLRIFGPLNGFDASELAPADCPEIHYEGPVRREEAMRLLHEGNLIVNVDNTGCVMTPSKIVECISTGRPILNVSHPGTDYPPMEEYVRRGYGLSVTAAAISDAHIAEIAAFIALSATQPSVSVDTIAQILAPHSIDAVLDRYLDVVRRAS